MHYFFSKKKMLSFIPKSLELENWFKMHIILHEMDTGSSVPSCQRGNYLVDFF